MPAAAKELGIINEEEEDMFNSTVKKSDPKLMRRESTESDIKILYQKQEQVGIADEDQIDKGKDMIKKLAEAGVGKIPKKRQSF